LKRGLLAVHVEEHLVAQGEVCTRRFPDAAAAWATAVPAARMRQQASALCQRWLEALAPEGELDRSLPALLVSARRLQPGPEPAR
jgi:hypothetical protein